MDGAAPDGEVLAETVFLSYFRDLPGPRQTGRVLYPLAGVLLLFTDALDEDEGAVILVTTTAR